MEIHVSSGTGSGPTQLAAFDAALVAAGMANYNLLPLSSSIPPGATVRRDPAPRSDAEWGHRLYVVLASQGASKPGSEAWAGVGWVQAGDGRGLFVEHHGESRRAVEQQIDGTLTAMVKLRSDDFGDIQSCVAGITCDTEPVCAVVVARYQAEAWDRQ